MRLILNVIWLIFGGLWLALGYFAGGHHLLHPHHHHPVRLRGVPHRGLRAVAVRLHGRRQAGPPARRAGRQRDLADPVRHLAGHRPRGDRGRDGHHDHRDPAGHRQPEAHPGVAAAAGQGDRPRRTRPDGRCPHDGDRARLAVVCAVARHGCAVGRAAARHLRPRRHRPAGLADRPVQPALHLLHARRGAGLVARRSAADRRRAGPAAATSRSPGSASPTSGSPAANRWCPATSRAPSPRPPR